MPSGSHRQRRRSTRGLILLLHNLTQEARQEGPKILRHKKLLSPAGAAFRIGFTGPPGAGKSTLVSGLLECFRKQNLEVAVVAVDPSSAFTGGAILGDRIRYLKHTLDTGMFVRSLGTRGSLGGLSAATYLMLRAFDLARFDVVLIETVGVGQTERAGIPSEIIERIFDPFFDVGKGTGLGLHIVKKEMDRHNGKITIASQPGKGTTFTLRIPKASNTRAA